MSARRVRTGPSWIEVWLGALISVLLGIVLGATLLIFRPVITAKQEPKERLPGRVYYFEGSRDGNRTSQALAKRQAFLNGESISVTEEEINSLVAAAERLAGTPASKGEKSPGGAAPSGAVAGTPVVRIHDGSLQVGVPLTAPLVGQKLTFQAHGTFVRKQEGFVYEPTAMYLGSLPLQRLPGVAAMVRDRLLAENPLPDDLKASWARLADVTIDGRVLKLTMP